MSHSIRRRILLGAPLALAAPTIARAQGNAAWPTKPVRIVVPFPAGGLVDTLARSVSQSLATKFGQPFVVDNRAGAGGNIGADLVAKAAPDGYTLLLGGSGSLTITSLVQARVPYDVATAFAPIGMMCQGPNVIVVHPSLPVRTAAEFLQYLKQNEGKLSYGTPGLGQSPHLSAVWYHQLTGTRATAVHYRGAGPAMVALMGGDIEFMFDNLTTAVEQVRAGRVRALGVTSAERNPQLPDLPAMRETAPELANYDVNTWFGAFYPAGTPQAAVDALNSEIKLLLEQPATKRRFEEMGGVPSYGTPADYARFVGAETEKWGAVLRKEGLQLDAG